MGSGYIPAHLRFNGQSMDVRNETQAPQVPAHRRFVGQSMDVRNEPQLVDALVKQSGAGFSHSGPSYTDREIFHHFSPNHDGKLKPVTDMLNVSEDQPDGLAFVLVYLTANPRWESNGIIFAKSSLHLLPEFREKLSEHRALMKQQAGHDNGGANGLMQSRHNDTKGAKIEMQNGHRHESGAKGVNGHHSGDSLSTQMKDQHLNAGDRGANGLVKETKSKGTLTTKDADASSQSPGHDLADAPNGSEEHDEPAYPTLVDIPTVNYSPSTQKLVAVFMTRGHTFYGFRFVGWHTIEKISIVFPKSTELGRLLEQRGDVSHKKSWSKARSKPTRLSEINQEWAVVKLTRMDPTAQGCLPAPAIQKKRVKKHHSTEEDRAEEAGAVKGDADTGNGTVDAGAVKGGADTGNDAVNAGAVKGGVDTGNDTVDASSIKGDTDTGNDTVDESAVKADTDTGSVKADTDTGNGTVDEGAVKGSTDAGNGIVDAEKTVEAQ